MTKFYAVRKGLQTGIFNTWEECRVLVSGYPGAEYKSFKTEDEAWAYMKDDKKKAKQIKAPKTAEGSGLSENLSKGIKPVREKSHAEDEDVMQEARSGDKAIAYVDGSFMESLPAYSYGAVIFWNDEKHCFCEAGDNPDLIGMRNVAGEIEGAQKAVRFCLEKGIKKLDIYYDYAGIEAWAKGAWKTNRIGTRDYKKFMQEAFNEVEVCFHKVKGHTGVTFNEEVDRLAKNAFLNYKAETELG